MGDVNDNYRAIQAEIAELAIKSGRDPSEITLVPVSKGHSVEKIHEVYEAGCRTFGENRVQEAVQKITQAPSDIHWHFIGTLQKNKVNKVIGKFSLIHSVDSVELAEAISDRSEGEVTKILLEVNTSGEEAKHGLKVPEWKEKFQQVLQLPGVQVEGLMTMAPYTDQQDVIRKCFRDLRNLRKDLALLMSIEEEKLHLSMGMSNDYLIAIEEGATLLRIGTAIFGERSIVDRTSV